MKVRREQSIVALEVGVRVKKTRRLCDIGHRLFHDASQWHGGNTESRDAAFELTQGTDAVNLVSVGMITIERAIVFAGKVGYNAAAYGDAHTEDIYENKHFILQQTSERNEEVVF
jgi:hypothetical protein